MPRRQLLFVVLLLAGFPACGDDEPGTGGGGDGDGDGDGPRVELLFSLPESEDLSPIEGLAEISVIARPPGLDPQIQTVRVDNGRSEIFIGEIAPIQGVEISVELRAANQRLIGFGRSRGLIDIQATGTTEVPIELRRPFAYLTGDFGITAFDGTLDLNSPDYRARIGRNAPATAVATSAGGDLILVASDDGAGGGSLRAIGTTDHEAVADISVPLARPPSSIAVSPDDQYVVVTHETTEASTGGITIARLADVVDNETSRTTFLEIGDASDLSIALGVNPDDAPIAMILLDASRDCDISGSGAGSSVIGLDLSLPLEPLFTLERETPVPDITVDALTRTLVLASPCTDQVLAVQPLSESPTFLEIQSVPLVNAVATRDGQVVSVGSLPYQEFENPDNPNVPIRIGASLAIQQSRLDGTAPAELELRPAEERAIALGIFENRLAAREIFAYDLALGPGGDLIAVLVRARHVGEKVVLTDGGQRRPFVPSTEVITYEYQLIDLAAGTQSQRLRTQCDLAVILVDEPFGYALPDWECSSSTGQDVLRESESFVPPHVSTLYGAR